MRRLHIPHGWTDGTWKTQTRSPRGLFAGFADFLQLGSTRKYEVWDTKLALSPKPYYPIQLCCYSEMLAATTEQGTPERIGVILGNGEPQKFTSKSRIRVMVATGVSVC
jgi:predicted RecB family nuclease